MQSDLANSLKCTATCQLKLASVLGAAWLFRLLACSQLKYLNDDDLSLAIFAMFDTMIIIGGFKIAQNQPSETITKLATAVYVLFALFVNMIGVMFAFETFVLFLHMFACESVAFEKMELSSDGLVKGEIQQCPWNTFDRVSCRVNEMCPFNSRSVVMILQQHWKRRLGMSATIFTLFVLAIFITLFGSLCMNLMKLLVRQFQGFRVNEEPAAPAPFLFTDNDDQPPPYPETKEKSYSDNASFQPV